MSLTLKRVCFLEITRKVQRGECRLIFEWINLGRVHLEWPHLDQSIATLVIFSIY
jgi:hypothetical protein